MNTIDDNQLFRKVAWHVLPLPMLGFFLAYVDRINIGFAQDQLSSQLGFSNTVYGLGAGLFFVGYFIFEIPSNLILARVGARKWIARIMITWGLISGCMAFVNSETTFYALRLLLGLAEAGFIPGVLFYMAQWIPASRRGRVWGVFYIALAASGLFGGMLSGFVLDGMQAVGGLDGWQWLFIVEAIPAVLLGLVILRCLHEDLRSVAWLDAAEKTRLAALLEAEAPAGGPTRLSRVFVSPIVWTLTAIYFSFNFALYGIGFWLPNLIRGLGIDNDITVGFVAALPSLAGIVAMLAFGYSSDRCGERKRHIAGAFTLSAVGFVLCIIAGKHAALGIVGLMLANAGALAIPAIFWSFQTSMLSGTALAGAIALINATGNLAGFAAPYLIGAVKDATHSAVIALWITAGFMALGACLTLAVRDGGRVSRTARPDMSSAATEAGH